MTTTLTEPTATGTGGTPHYRMWIDDRWVDAEEHFEVVNPATGDAWATCAKATTADVDAAVAAARASFQGGAWRTTPPNRRADLLERVVAHLVEHIDALTVLGTKENGAPLRLSRALSVGFPVAHIQHFADLLRSYQWERPAPLSGGPMLHAGVIRREPIGVCAGIVPWNFPLVLTVWKALPAIAAGNSVVIKTDEKTPVGALTLASVLQECGLPAGVYNVVVGDGPVVGGHLVAHPDVDKVSFTGSTATGREVMRSAAGTIKGVTLELGGKGPNLVLDDADLDVAVDGTIYGFLLHAGQACESGTRLLLPRALHDDFVHRLVKRITTLEIGDPLDPSTDIGPVMSGRQRDRILAYIEQGRAEGATVVCGGGVPAGAAFEKGFWVEPTVFVDVDNSMCIAREEIFGPVLAVIPYDSLDEAIAIANDTPYGLAAGVWGRDVSRALQVADSLQAGSVWINDWHNINQYMPFGGYKQSGSGRELGPDALDAFTEQKSITIDLSAGLEARAYGLVLGTPPGVPG